MTITNIRPGERIKVASRGVTPAELALKQDADAQLQGIVDLTGTGVVVKINTDEFETFEVGVSGGDSFPNRSDSDARYQAISAALTEWATKARPAGATVGTTDTQTLSGKTLTSPTINGGTITGITDLAVADGGTGASSASAARASLGLVLDTDVPSQATFVAVQATVINTRDEVIAARSGAANLDAHMDAVQAAAVATQAEVTAARSGAASLDAHLDAVQGIAEAVRDEVIAARSGGPSLDAHLDAVQGIADDAQAEITAARSGAATLKLRLDATRDVADAAQAEITAARSGAASLDAHLDAVQGIAEDVRDEVIAARSGGPSLDAHLDAVQGIAEDVRDEVIAARSGAATLDLRLDATRDIADEVTAEVTGNRPTLSDLIGNARHRPGDTSRLYSAEVTGPASDRTPIDDSWVQNLSGIGACIVVPEGEDDAVVGPRLDLDIEPGHRYLVRYKVKRIVDPSDPLNDAVALRMQYLNYLKSTVTTATYEALALEVDQLEQEYQFIIGTDATDDTLDFVIPASVLYVTPHVKCFGDDHSTAIIVIDWEDITYNVVISNQVEAVISDVRRQTINYLTVSGGNGASTTPYQAAASPTLEEITGRLVIAFIPGEINAASPLIDIDNRGNQEIRGPDGLSLLAGDMPADELQLAIFIGSDFRLFKRPSEENMNYVDYDLSRVVGTSAVDAIAADPTRVSLLISNAEPSGGSSIAINPSGGTPIINGLGSITLSPGGAWEPYKPPKTPITILGGAVDLNVTILTANRSGVHPNLSLIMEGILENQVSAELTGEKLEIATTFVGRLLNANIWSSLDHLHVPMLAMNNDERRRDWIDGNGGSLQGTVNEIDNEGWAGDGSTGYYTHGVPLTGGKFAPLSGHMACFELDAVTHATTYIMGNGNCAVGPNRTATTAAYRSFNTTAALVTVGGRGGFFAWSRNIFETFDAYWQDNHFEVTDDGNASIGALDYTLLANAETLGPADFTSGTLSVASVGGFLSRTQMAAYNAACIELADSVSEL